MPRSKKVHPMLLFLIPLLMGICASAHGAIYSYRDDTGRLFLTDNPPNSKYKIIVTTIKDREGPDLPKNVGNPVLAEMAPQKVLLPNDETFSSIINEAAKFHGLDPYLIKAVIKVESDFDPNIVSSKGAQGLMQLIPSTARLMNCNDPFDPYQNIMGGAKYLQAMLSKFRSNLDLALAAYNAGPGRVEQYSGVPPFRETRNYVKKVNHYYRQFRANLPVTRMVRKTTGSFPVLPSTLSKKLSEAYSVYLDNNVDGAIRAYQDILNIFPRNTQALYNLACLLDMERRYNEAIDAYLAALKEDPFLDKAIYNLAIIYERLGHHREAIEAWKKFVQATKDEDKITMAERYVKELEEYVALNR